MNSRKLRRFASEHLARFKVPGLIRIVPAIPAGSGGTIVRSELATALSIVTPRSRIERNGHLAAPRSETEWQLARIWADFLELNEVGVDEDVFALGADSLTVAQLLSRLRVRFGVDCSFSDIFDAPSVAASRPSSRPRNIKPSRTLTCATWKQIAVACCQSSNRELTS